MTDRVSMRVEVSLYAATQFMIFNDRMICMSDLELKLSLEDSKEPQTAHIHLYKFFYDQTDRGLTHFLLNLIKSFGSHTNPKDLIGMIYIVVQLMKNLQAHGTLRFLLKSWSHGWRKEDCGRWMTSVKI
eukprot:XP_019081419.1 PREDICTED: uncharacterized protein LOC100251792 isoform X2 [Vitis vinifera]